MRSQNIFPPRWKRQMLAYLFKHERIQLKAGYILLQRMSNFVVDQCQHSNPRYVKQVSIKVRYQKDLAGLIEIFSKDRDSGRARLLSDFNFALHGLQAHI